jgi:cytochrome P450
MSDEEVETPLTERTAMQPFGANATAKANSERLSLLRLLNPDVLADPYALYRALREHDPVHWDPYMHAWVVTSYRRSCYSSDELFSRPRSRTGSPGSAWTHIHEAICRNDVAADAI